MKNGFKPLFIFEAALVFLLLFSCEGTEGTKSNEDSIQISPTHGPSRVKLNPVVVDTLRLKSNYMYDYSNYSGFITSTYDGTEVVSNLSNGKIFTFNQNTGNLIDLTTLPDEGPGSMETNSTLDGVIGTSDGGYIYSNQMLSKIFSIKDNYAKSKFQLEEDNYYLGASFFAKPIQVGDDYIFPMEGGSSMNLKGRKSLLVYNSSTNQSYKALDYPIEYHGNYYGSMPYFYWPSIVYIPENKEFYVSFPISKYIYVYNESFDLIRKKTAVAKSTSSVEPLVTNVNYDNLPASKENREYFIWTPYYSGLMYDTKNNLIYRLLRSPVPDDIEAGCIHTLVVLNLDLEKIGEWVIPDNFRPESSFCSNKGLNLLNLDYLENDTNFDLVFYTYNF